MTESQRRKVLIDTDPGIDDAMAIFYALESPELEVVGVTTVFGNADTDVTTRNALSLLEIAQRSDIPVAAGAVKPLAMDYRGPAAFVHGPDGQGGVNLPAPVTAPLAADAAHFIIDTVMSSPGQITLVPLGPLTNVALAMLLEPTLTQQIPEIVLMGGPRSSVETHHQPERRTSSTTPRQRTSSLGPNARSSWPVSTSPSRR